MLEFIFTDINDKKFSVFNVLSMSIDMENDVPCDEMTAVFECFPCDELKEVVVKDEKFTVFTGVVDEQSCVINENGKLLSVSCRSMAAKLLDNESLPVSYHYPCENTIEVRHLRPFSIPCVGENRIYHGTQTVLKGESNWKAVEDFSKKVYGKAPRVNEMGQLVFCDGINSSTIKFSNTSNGIPYLSLSETIRRCDELSKVKIKVDSLSSFDNVVENTDAIKRGIRRERYINTVMTDTPACLADRMIENSKAKAYQLKLVCTGCHLDIFGKNAQVDDVPLKFQDELFVDSLHYRLSSQGETTTVILKRKDVKNVAV